jgi:hypothetical protein
MCVLGMFESDREGKEDRRLVDPMPCRN